MSRVVAAVTGLNTRLLNFSVRSNARSDAVRLWP